RALGVRMAEATASRRPRELPALTGTLALDTDRLVRVHARFAGEVVTLGTVEGYDPESQESSRPPRPLRYADPLGKRQLLAVVWSKDLGEKKSELADAVSRLKLDEEILKRALRKQEVLPDVFVLNAQRTVDADLIAVARAERTLRSWRLTE